MQQSERLPHVTKGMINTLLRKKCCALDDGRGSAAQDYGLHTLLVVFLFHCALLVPFLHLDTGVRWQQRNLY